MSSEERKGPSRGLIFLLIGGLLAGLVMALFTVAGSSILSALGFIPALSGGVAPTPRPALVQIDSPALDFEGQTPDGRTITLSELQGHPVAINFWATWCAPCLVEMPALEEAAQRYSDQGLIVLAVNAGESPQVIADFMEEEGLTFDAVQDVSGDIVDLYGVEYFPTTYWVDAAGVVRAKHLGSMDRRLIDSYMDVLLAAPLSNP